MFQFFASKFSSLCEGVIDFFGPDKKAALQQQLRSILIEADVPLKVIDQFCQRVLDVFEQRVKKLPKADKNELLRTALYNELLHILGTDIDPANDFPQAGIIVFAGLQGAGKTTTIAKLGKWLMTHKKISAQNLLCTSLDFTRPAAIEQLEVMCKKAGVSFIPPIMNDLDGTLKVALQQYKSLVRGYLLIDTAGRLNVDQALMQELQHVCQQVKPTLKILVLDAMTGQKSLEVAQDFKDQVGVDRSILTKVDSDARGGCALALRWVTQMPISFIATGERVDDLEPFIASRVASRIVGSGDVASLADKIESSLRETGKEDAFKNSAERLMSGAFTLNDFLQQMRLFSSLGSLGRLASYIPGLSGLSSSQIAMAEAQNKVFTSLVESMTFKERLNPRILNASRKRRVCVGAGRRIQDLELLLEKFEQTKQFVKMVSKAKY